MTRSDPFNLKQYSYKGPALDSISHPSFRGSAGMGLRFTSPEPPRKPHSWTEEHKRYLLCCCRFFSWTYLEISKVLNHHFQLNAFSPKKVHSYRYSLEHNGLIGGRQLYTLIFDTTPLLSPPLNLRRIINNLRISARALGLSTRSRSREKLSPELRSGNRKSLKKPKASNRYFHGIPLPSQPQIRKKARQDAPRPLRGDSMNTDYLPRPPVVDLTTDSDTEERIHSYDVISDSEEIEENESPDNFIDVPDSADDPFAFLGPPERLIDWLKPMPLRLSHTPDRAQRVITPTPLGLTKSYQIISPSEADISEPSPRSKEYFKIPPRYLFRAYSTESAGVNGLYGFQAGHFPKLHLPIPKPPTLTNEPFQIQLANHFSREMCGSPVISTTHSFAWAVHKALGVPQSSISVMDHQSINGYTQTYPAQEVLKLLRSKPNYVPSQHKWYRGAAEYIVWCRIKEESVLHTIPVSAIEDLATQSVFAAMILRLHVLKGQSSLRKARTIFKSQRVQFAATAIGFINILLCLQVTPVSPSDQVEAMTYSITQGWALELPTATQDLDRILDDTFDAWWRMGGGGESTGEHGKALRTAFHKGIKLGAKEA